MPSEPSPHWQRRYWLLTLAGAGALAYGLAHLALVPTICGLAVLLEVWILDDEH